MNFLHPGLLWLLPLALVPILLHLLTLHRLKTVELSTYRFLFDSYVQQRRSMKFLEALLAMLRTLFVLLLVGVICRPVIKHWADLFKSGSGREVVLLVDCSASMNARSEGMSAFDRAKSAALTVAERLNADDRLTLVRITSRPEEVFSRFSSDAEAIRNKIEELKPSPSRANLFAALTQLFGPEAEHRTNPMVYLFTDCQTSGWKEVQNQGLERLIPEGTPFVVVNVGSTEPIANLAVVGKAPPQQRAIVGLPVYLHPHVVNYSRAEAEVAVNVLIDEKEVARVPLKKLKAGEEGSGEVIYFPGEPGIHRGRFELSAKSPDGFPDDDNFYFTLAVVPPPRVLLVNGNPAADAYESETLFLEAALNSGAQEEKKAAEGKPPANEPARDFLRSLDTRQVPEAGLNPETLQDTSVVVLANCGALTPQQCGWLQEFVGQGGGLLIFPGDRVNPDLYNKQLFPVPGPQQEQLTPLRLGAPQGDLEKAETFEHVAVIDFAHPVLSIFNDPEAHYFSNVYFKKRFTLTVPEQRSGFSPLAEFSSGSPALVESHYGDGLVVLAAFPANPKWTNLPLKKAEFVPLVLRLVSHVQHRPEAEGPSAVSADGVAKVAVAEGWGPASGKVTDPAGRSSPLAFERSGSRLLGAFERTLDKGYYTVEVKSDRPDQPRGATLAFAVNLAPEESDFATLGESQFRDLLPGAQLTLVDATGQAQQLYGTLGNEREVARPMIWVLFVIIFVEFMLATLGGGKRETEENLTVAERIRRLSPGSWVGRMTGAAPKEKSE